MAGIVAAAVVAGLIVLFCCAMLIFVLYKRKREIGRTKVEEKVGLHEDNESEKPKDICTQVHFNLSIFLLNKLRNTSSHLKI